MASVQPLGSAQITHSGGGKRDWTAELVRTVALTPLAAAFLTVAQLGVVVIARMVITRGPLVLPPSR